MAEPFVEGLANLDSRSSLAMSSPITVAVPHGFIGQVLPEAVRDLRSAIPTARIRVLSGPKEEVFELVQPGGGDFAVAPDPGASRRFDFAQIGRASCRERVCQAVKSSGGAVAFTKNSKKIRNTNSADAQ